MWLGQAGFALRGSDGRVFMIDPYLSNHAEDSHGLSRLVAAPVSTDLITPEFLLITHSHVDHLDPPTMRAYGHATDVTLITAPQTALLARERFGWQGGSIELSAGESVELDGARVAATWTRHGSCEEAPGEDEAIGFLLEIDGVTMWHAGDTEYDARLHRSHARSIDVAFLPINGSGGNMNAHEAALLAWQLKVRIAVPMHFGMWPDNDYAYAGEEPYATPWPEQFVKTYGLLDPSAGVSVPALGEIVAFRSQSPG
jgi:L-ascorbate 6-phosphate lactonase